MQFVLFLFFSLLLASTTMARADTCSVGKPPCQTDLGNYHIALPEQTPEGDLKPALIFFHGAGGNGERTLKNRKMVKPFLDAGFAIIAPTGLKRPNSRWGPMWSFHPLRSAQRDELEFTKAVLADAARRFGVDRKRVLMSGFSIGGSLVWYLACKDPGIAAAYAPVAGSFWRPHPEGSDCSGPFNLLHTHGWRDGVVPLEGRVLGGGSIVQGDVFRGFEILRTLNGCSNLKADKFDTSGDFWRRWWTQCDSSNALQLNLFDGGHSVPPAWPIEAIEWFEAVLSVN